MGSGGAPGRRRREAPKVVIKWLRNVADDLKEFDMDLLVARATAQNRPLWRIIAKHGATLPQWSTLHLLLHIRAKCSVGLCVFLQPDLDLNIDYSAALMYRIAHDIMSFNGMYATIQCFFILLCCTRIWI